MDKAELQELHYITLISNIPSIMARGILSNKSAKKIRHQSLAKEEIQDRREKKVIPGGRPLHEYANLYFHARNPMLYLRQDHHNKICVLRVNIRVLDLPGVIITDCNASSDYVRFVPAPQGLKIVDKELTFAEYWTDSDPIQMYRRKSAKCAEVLIPDRVDPCFIIGAYVSCPEAKVSLEELDKRIQITINPHFFFR